MSKSYHQVPDEIAGDFPQHMPDTHIHVLGHDIVRADLQALENQLEADASTERVAWMEQILAEKLAPREVSARERVLGKLGLRNDIMTANESGLVTSIGLQDVGNAERLQPHIEDDKAYVDEALEQARTALLWLDKQPDPKRIQALFWMNDSLSPHQRAIYRSEFEENPSITLFRWLAEKKADTMPDNTEEEQRAKKDQEAEDKHRLLNFLQSHNAYLADRQQSPEFVEAVNQQKKLFTQGIKKGLSEGWFHDSAKEALARVGGFRVYLGDFFTTDFSHRGGYYIIGDKNQVSVGEGAVEHATVHELNHALLETFPNPEDTRKPFNQTWLLEAVTEELAQTFKGGEFGEFNTNVGSYPEYRGLLRTVVDIARQLRTGVDFSDFTRAYSAPIEEQDEMVRQIADAFYDSGYPNYSIFADVESVMEQRLKDINSDPDTSRLPFRAKQNLAAKQTAGNLRSVARSLVDKNDQEVATS